MIKTAINTITAHFGEPVRRRDKVLAWAINDNFGLVVERNTPEKGHYANIWIPHFSYAKTLPNNIAKQYKAGQGRHSNTYASTGLEKGKPAIKIKVKNGMELADLISYVDALKHFKA